MCVYFHKKDNWCFAVAHNIGKMGRSQREQRDYIRPATCNGNKECCDFKKFGLKVEVQK